MSGRLLNKDNLAALLSTRVGISKTQARRSIDALFEVIAQEVARGNRVQVRGFGTFDVRHYSSRKVQTPSKEVVTLPEWKLPGFRASARFRRMLRKREGEHA